jgi:NADH-quinone oxidoreductase subunit N
VFIAVEMASVPSYALAGFLKGRRQSSEAALKYVVYGGGASGVMLYGISLVAGRYGTGYIPDLAQAIQAQMSAGGTGIAALDTMVLLGLVFILAGLAFKLSAVPFHFWCPDVFEGAAAEIGAFLSVASKAAALVLTGRLLLTLAGAGETGLVVVMPKTFVPVLAFFAALTATFGNLAAYAQTNLKRLLAYSTIAHAGYMLMGLATMTDEGLSSVLFYIVAYVFMNLGAFAMVAFLRNKTGSEDLSSFRGLVYRSPLLVVLFGVFLISLLGLPPLAGFTAKFQVFAAVYHAGEGYMPTSPALGYTMYALLLIGGINTVFSLFYYLKVLRVMVLEKPLEEMENRPAAPLPLSAGATVFAGFLAAMIFVAGVAFDPLATAADKGAMNFSTLTGALPTGQVARPGAGGGGGPAPGGPRPGGGAPGGGARPGGGQPKGNNPAQPKGKTAP